jgi:hypothetical protein
MMVPGSVSDWAQICGLGGLLGGTAVAFTRALREDERPLPAPAVSAERGSVPVDLLHRRYALARSA